MKNANREHGFVLVFLGAIILVLLGICGYTVDYGYTYYQKLRLQSFADNTALSVVKKVQSANADATIQSQANTILSANNVDLTTEKIDVTCGRYNPTKHTFYACSNTCPSTGTETCPCRNCTDSDVDKSNATAVRVRLQRQVPTFFARVFGISSFTPDVQSIALANMANSPNCIRPFGIEAAAVAGKGVGSTFTVGKTAAGNWGKLDLGINASSAPDFTNAMYNSVCSNAAAKNSSVSAGTGASTIKDIFDQLVARNDSTNLIFAIVSPFPNGNGNVTIQDYIKVDYISDNGRNGGNWEGTFKVVEKPAFPPEGDGTGTISRSYLAYVP